MLCEKCNSSYFVVVACQTRCFTIRVNLSITIVKWSTHTPHMAEWNRFMFLFFDHEFSTNWVIPKKIIFVLEDTGGRIANKWPTKTSNSNVHFFKNRKFVFDYIVWHGLKLKPRMIFALNIYNGDGKTLNFKLSVVLSQNKWRMFIILEQWAQCKWTNMVYANVIWSQMQLNICLMPFRLLCIQRRQSLTKIMLFTDKHTWNWLAAMRNDRLSWRCTGSYYFNCIQVEND